MCIYCSGVAERGISVCHALSYGHEIDKPLGAEFAPGAGYVPSLWTLWNQLAPIVWLPEKRECPRAGMAFPGKKEARNWLSYVLPRADALSSL